MFTRWGDLVFRFRYAVIGIMVAALAALGGYGLSLNDHLSQSGAAFFDPGSESDKAAKLLDATYGRDTNSDVLALYTAPDGKTVDDPEFAAKITASLDALVRDHPDQILKINSACWRTATTAATSLACDASKQHGIASVAIKGDNDTAIGQNYRDVESAFQIPGVKVQLAGGQPIAGGIAATTEHDIRRMEVLAIPLVGVLLFFVFGGVIAAGLPLVIGGLTVVGAWGIVRLITMFTEVNSFVSPVVSLIGLGLAIDYGLFIVSRFREELAEGYDTHAAVRRTVTTAGRTVVFSATMIVASLGGLLLFPHGFLKSVAYGAIATVSLAALTSITILPAILGILGKRIDMLGIKRLEKGRSAEQVENGMWGKLTRWVMKRPLTVTVPIVIGLLLLIIPVNGIQFGGISEKLLPPGNSARVAQEDFDRYFPLRPPEPIKLALIDASAGQVAEVINEANNAPGLKSPFAQPTTAGKDGVWKLETGLSDRSDAGPTIDYLRSMPVPEGVTVQVTGVPALEYDSINSLLDRMPLMIAFVVLATTLLMFLTFGSLVLPIKAALMSALGLGSTLGILTWIFIDGHGAGIIGFTPGPLLSPMLVLIIAIIYGLSTDYEVFILSRMVEARAMGASTPEAIRVGTTHTSRIITAAALILIVVTGAFGFSDLVIMQYIAYGMISALVIDATLIRMFLVPATMKLLGDDCWWAPAWLKRIQERLGLGEPILHDERVPADVPVLATVPSPTDLTTPMPKIVHTPPPRKTAAAQGVESWLTDLRGSSDGRGADGRAVGHAGGSAAERASGFGERGGGDRASGSAERARGGDRTGGPAAERTGEGAGGRDRESGFGERADGAGRGRTGGFRGDAGGTSDRYGDQAGTNPRHGSSTGADPASRAEAADPGAHDPALEDTGRHRRDSSQALSVAELLRRARRQ